MHPNAGGPPVVVDRVCRRLAARGHRVRAITTDALSCGQIDWERSYSDGGYQLDIHKTKGSGSFAYSGSLAQAVKSAVAESDLVHLHTLWTYPTLKAAWECRKQAVPYIVMPHGMLDPNSVRHKRLKKWLYSKLFEGPNLLKAGGLIFTHPEEERLARETISDLPPGSIVPLAADEPPSTDRRQLAEEFFTRCPELAGKPTVLFLGRLHPKKGLELLITAFGHFAGQAPHARLAIVGPGDAAYREKLNSLALQLGISDRVFFLGHLSGREKWAALAAATVFVLPSYQENFAITVVEAMSIGTPVLISPYVNICRDVEEADAGVVSILDASVIAARLLEFISDPKLACRLGTNGSELVRRNYNWDRTADAVEIVYRSILSPRSPKHPAQGASRPAVTVEMPTTSIPTRIV
jgi:glycosyltransferase involved in cell wall biosynthesis